MNFKDIKDYDGICAAIKEDPKVFPIVDNMSEAEGRDVVNSFMYKRMVRAMNVQPDGSIWEPNYYTKDEKIEPWLEVEADEQRPGGFGFSRSGNAFWLTDTFAGARRAFQSSERFRHAFETFPEMFKHEYLIIK
jgi:hypothetical protein